MTETQLRFLRAIAERVPLERIVDVHLFPSMKQGIVETGIAVIAAERERPVVQGELLEEGAGSELQTEDGASTIADAQLVEGAGEADEIVPSSDANPQDSSPALPPAPSGARNAATARHTVYSARYRLTLKGPERGRWEVDVTEEADAPLLTVEVVVRGVQRRAGEGADPERVGAEALRTLIEG